MKGPQVQPKGQKTNPDQLELGFLAAIARVGPTVLHMGVSF